MRPCRKPAQKQTGLAPGSLYFEFGPGTGRIFAGYLSLVPTIHRGKVYMPRRPGRDAFPRVRLPPCHREGGASRPWQSHQPENLPTRAVLMPPCHCEGAKRPWQSLQPAAPPYFCFLDMIYRMNRIGRVINPPLRSHRNPSSSIGGYIQSSCLRGANSSAPSAVKSPGELCPA